jgi:hypothetical protein
MDAADLFGRVPRRRAREGRQYCKVAVPSALAQRPKVFFDIVNHRLLERRLLGRTKKVKAKLTDRLHLAHFPVRSIPQITTKAFLGWAARLASADCEGSVNWHLKALFERLMTDQDLDPTELTELALSYCIKEGDADTERELVWDPMRTPGAGIQLRRPGQQGARPLIVLADLAERFARELRDARAPRAGRGRSLRGSAGQGAPCR